MRGAPAIMLGVVARAPGCSRTLRPQRAGRTVRTDPKKARSPSSSSVFCARAGKSSAAERRNEWEEMFDRSGNERQTSSSGLFDPWALRSGTVSAGGCRLGGRQRRLRDGTGGALRRFGVYAARDRRTAAARILWGPVGGQANGDGDADGRGLWGGGKEGGSGRRDGRRWQIPHLHNQTVDGGGVRVAARGERDASLVGNGGGGHLSITER